MSNRVLTFASHSQTRMRRLCTLGACRGRSHLLASLAPRLLALLRRPISQLGLESSTLHNCAGHLDDFARWDINEHDDSSRCFSQRRKNFT